jgi:hypothetical protein
MVINKPTSICVGKFRKDENSIFEKPDMGSQYGRGFI